MLMMVLLLMMKLEFGVQICETGEIGADVGGEGVHGKETGSHS